MTVKDLKEFLSRCNDDDVVSLFDVENGERIETIYIDDSLYGRVEFK